jgi:uncharacterized integral membrane protein
MLRKVNKTEAVYITNITLSVIIIFVIVASILIIIIIIIFSIQNYNKYSLSDSSGDTKFASR